MIRQDRAAALIAPDSELQTEFRELVRALLPFGEPALQATLGLTSYSELWRYQEKALRDTTDTTSPPMPYWLRSSRERSLLACLTLARNHRKASAYLASALRTEELWPALLPALARKAALDDFDTLLLEGAALPAPSHIFNDSYITDFRVCDSGYLLTFAAEPSSVNLYTDSAPFYDLDLEERSACDLPFYLRLCAELAPRTILDLACGNGRITLPLLEAGHTVTACDHSSAMLNILRRRLALLPAVTRRRASLDEGSLTSFAFDNQFDLILAPFRSLQMLCAEELRLCLERIMVHLNPSGYLVFDLTNPETQDLNALLMPESIVWSETDPIDSSRVVKKTWCDLVDNRQQRVRHGVVWEVTDTNGWRRHEDVLRYSFYTADQMHNMLSSVGFHSLQCYGDFTGGPLGRGEELIFVAQKKEL